MHKPIQAAHSLKEREREEKERKEGGKGRRKDGREGGRVGITPKDNSLMEVLMM